MSDNQAAEMPEPESTGVNKGGRPELELDADQIIRLAELQCSMREIAYVMGCHPDTLKKRFSEEIDSSGDSPAPSRSCRRPQGDS